MVCGVGGVHCLLAAPPSGVRAVLRAPRQATRQSWPGRAGAMKLLQVSLRLLGSLYRKLGTSVFDVAWVEYLFTWVWRRFS